MTRRHHHCRECRQGVRFYQSILCSVERHPRRSSLFHPPSRSYSCARDTHTSMAHGIYVRATRINPTFTCHPICTRHSRRSSLFRSPSRLYFCACDTHTHTANGICDSHISYMYMLSHMHTSSQKMQSRPLPLSSLLSHTHSHAVARA